MNLMVGMLIYYQVSTTECFVAKYSIFSLGEFADIHTHFINKTAFSASAIIAVWRSVPESTSSHDE